VNVVRVLRAQVRFRTDAGLAGRLSWHRVANQNQGVFCLPQGLSGWHVALGKRESCGGGIPCCREESKETVEKESRARYRGCSAQTCDLNALSRSASYRCFISSIDLPTGGPGTLKTQAQAEQAQPWNRSRSTHSISRAKEHLHQEKVREGQHNDASWTPSQVGELNARCGEISLVHYSHPENLQLRAGVIWKGIGEMLCLTGSMTV
jgi:hypothetical protein